MAGDFEGDYYAQVSDESRAEGLKWKERILDSMRRIEACHQIDAETLQGKCGVYSGIAGLAYMYLKAAKSETLCCKDDRQVAKFLEKGLEFLTPPLVYFYDYPMKHRCQDDIVAFIPGAMSVHVLHVAVLKNLKQRLALRDALCPVKNAWLGLCVPDFLPCGSDGYFCGRAGYLSALRWLEFELGTNPLEWGKLSVVLTLLLERGRDYAVRTRSPSPLMYCYDRVEYLGPCHGLSTILMTFLMYPDWLRSTAYAERDVKQSVDYILSLQSANGNFPSSANLPGTGCLRTNDPETLRWCQGAPGMVHLMAAAFRLWGDAEYLESCRKCADVTWELGLTEKGPGLCHGIAGNGYVFLVLYRLTGEKNYLRKAAAFAEFLYTEEIAKAAESTSQLGLFEGLAGAVCFLIDFIEPDTAEFPFFTVFSSSAGNQLSGKAEPLA